MNWSNISLRLIEAAGAAAAAFGTFYAATQSLEVSGSAALSAFLAKLTPAQIAKPR